MEKGIVKGLCLSYSLVVFTGFPCDFIRFDNDGFLHEMCWDGILRKLCMFSKVFYMKRDVQCFLESKLGFAYMMSYAICVHVNVMVVCYVHVWENRKII